MTIKDWNVLEKLLEASVKFSYKNYFLLWGQIRKDFMERKREKKCFELCREVKKWPFWNSPLLTWRERPAMTIWTGAVGTFPGSVGGLNWERDWHYQTENCRAQSGPWCEICQLSTYYHLSPPRDLQHRPLGRPYLFTDCKFYSGLLLDHICWPRPPLSPAAVRLESTYGQREQIWPGLGHLHCLPQQPRPTCRPLWGEDILNRREYKMFE